jgi:predicted acyl esterase
MNTIPAIPCRPSAAFTLVCPSTGRFDQRPVESRADVLVFTTPPLTEPLEIVGQVQAKLWASSDRKDTDFTVKLTDVYPDGRSMIFLDGIVKGRYRNGYLEEELLEAWGGGRVGYRLGLYRDRAGAPGTVCGSPFPAAISIAGTSTPTRANLTASTP